LSSIGRRDETIEVAAARRIDSQPRAKHFRGRSARVEPVSAPRDADDGGIGRLCAERGLKMTGQRRTIARVLTEADDHPDVEELYRRAVLLDARISIATVYRTVRLFEEKGILQRRDFGSGRARYEPTEHGPHYHLIDVETGNVVEFKSAEHECLVRALAKQLGFEVVSLRLEIFGKGLDTSPSLAPAKDRLAPPSNVQAGDGTTSA
jgi:Fur family transcriptional regulator, ferric uptake regulator